MEVESGEWRYASLPYQLHTYVEDNSAPKRARPAFFHLLLILVPPFSPTSTGRLYGKVLGSVSQSAVVARYIWEGGGPRKWAAKEEKGHKPDFYQGMGFHFYGTRGVKWKVR